MQCFTLINLVISNSILLLLLHTAKHLFQCSKKNILRAALSTIWENTDGFAGQYRCSSALYLMSGMSQCYSIIIDRGISATAHGKEVVYGLNAVYKRYIYQLMSTVLFPVSNIFDSQMQMHTGTQKYDVSLAR